MVTIAAQDISVDLAVLQGFSQHLQSRIDEANSALTMLTTTPGADPPALGTFDDARLTVDRHQSLHDQYGQRLRHLLDALNAAASATATIVDKYRVAADHDHVRVSDILTALLPVSEALNGNRSHA